MASRIALSDDVLARTCCPVCRSKVRASGTELRCMGTGCDATFPVVDGVPILLNEANSVFRIDDFTAGCATYFKERSRALRRVASWLPDLGHDIKAEQNYEGFAELLLEHAARPRVLVLGGGVLGTGLARLLARDVEMVESDVALAPRTRIVLDAHDIPFEDETFDGVVAQAVLEHVVDPYRCVDEIHRVLKSGGVLYADVPFMQQVHGGAYDFPRLTHLGLRRLFRRFSEISIPSSFLRCASCSAIRTWFLNVFAGFRLARRPTTPSAI